MYLPNVIVYKICNYIPNNLKYIIMKYKTPYIYNKTINACNTIRTWFHKYKLPKRNNEYNFDKIWKNKYYIIRLILAYYNNSDIIHLPETIKKKISLNNYFQENYETASQINIISIINRKPSDVRRFLLSKCITTSILKYNGW